MIYSRLFPRSVISRPRVGRPRSCKREAKTIRAQATQRHTADPLVARDTEPDFLIHVAEKTYQGASQ